MNDNWNFLDNIIRANWLPNPSAKHLPTCSGSKDQQSKVKGMCDYFPSIYEKTVNRKQFFFQIGSFDVENSRMKVILKEKFYRTLTRGMKHALIHHEKILKLAKSYLRSPSL